ncbi:MAG: MFS transporter [Clostridia bacterium]|nr:MFS transporter [Clostridia bacterium]
MEKFKSQHFGYTPEQYKKFTGRAWVYLIMFSLLYCCFYCMRLNLSNASALIQEGMGWGNEEIGILTSTLFWTYGIGHLINGRISEMVGPSKFIVLAVILSFISNIAMGAFGGSLFVMALIWGINGYFQSMAWTPGIATLTNWWPGSKRGFAVGFAHAFSGFGQVLIILMVTLTAIIGKGIDWNSGFFQALGWTAKDTWRLSFFIPPLLPIVMLVFYMLIGKPHPKKVGLPEYEESDPQRAAEEAEMAELIKTRGKLFPYIHVLSNKKFLLLVFICFLIGIARYGLTTWVPLYFIQEFGKDIEEGLLGSLTLPIGMAIGTLTVPSLTDKYCPTNRLPAVILSAVASAVMVLAFLLFNPTSPWQFAIIMILLFFAGFGIYSINGLAFAVATDVGGRIFSGTCSGIMDFTVYMGAGVQAVIYGFVSEKFGWSWVFVSMGIFLILIALLAFFGSPKKKAA